MVGSCVTKDRTKGGGVSHICVACVCGQVFGHLFGNKVMNTTVKLSSALTEVGSSQH